MPMCSSLARQRDGLCLCQHAVCLLHRRTQLRLCVAALTGCALGLKAAREALLCVLHKGDRQGVVAARRRRRGGALIAPPAQRLLQCRPPCLKGRLCLVQQDFPLEEAPLLPAWEAHTKEGASRS